jgi:hypothetical protein
MSKRILLFSMALVVAGLTLAWAAQGETRWATGEVLATDTEAQPNTIVVSTKNWRGQDTVVGAAVDENTVIKMGKRKVPLEAIKPGDVVDIVYDRNKSVVAKSIKIKR